MQLLCLPILSFLITLATTPIIIKKSYEKGIVGIDLHKLDRREIPRAGGLTIFAGYLGALTLAGFLPLDEKLMLSIFLSSSLGALIGLVDDIFTLNRKTLVALTFVVGLPIITFRAGSTVVTIHPFGPVDLGVGFWLLVPLIFAFLTNSVNIYAGFNGLEAGLGVITCLSLGISAFIYGAMESATSLITISGALLGFLYHNKYPAKVFLGNSGTYLIGAVLAASIIAGVIKMAGIIACFPYVINFILRAIDRFTWTVGETNPDERIYTDKRSSLWALFIVNHPRDERTIVYYCLVLQMVFGVTAILYSILMNYWI